MRNAPDRLHMDKTDRDLYHELDEEEMLRSSGKGGERNRKEQFLFAMAVGFVNGVKRPLETKEGFFLAKDLRPDDEALLKAVALADTGRPEVLLDLYEVFRIAEEYAHAGITLLVEKIHSTALGSYEKSLERDLQDLAR